MDGLPSTALDAGTYFVDWSAGLFNAIFTKSNILKTINTAILNKRHMGLNGHPLIKFLKYLKK